MKHKHWYDNTYHWCVAILMSLKFGDLCTLELVSCIFGFLSSSIQDLRNPSAMFLNVHVAKSVERTCDTLAGVMLDKHSRWCWVSRMFGGVDGVCWACSAVLRRCWACWALGWGMLSMLGGMLSILACWGFVDNAGLLSVIFRCSVLLSSIEAFPIQLGICKPSCL